MPRPAGSNPKTRTRVIELRKELTLAERKLWSSIRNDQLGVGFRSPSDPPEPAFLPVEKSAAGKKWTAIEDDRALQARELRKRIRALKTGETSR